MVFVMSNDLHQIQEDALAAKLRREADQFAPQFSAELHARIMSGVDAAAVTRIGGRRGPYAMPLKATLLAGAVAAMIFLSATGSLSRRRTIFGPLMIARSTAVAKPTHSRPPVAILHETARQVDLGVQMAMQSALERQQFAGLDHDVRLATQYLIDQAPFRSAWDAEVARQ